MEIVQISYQTWNMVGGRNPAPVNRWFIKIVYKVSTIQGGAGFRNHPQYGHTLWIFPWTMHIPSYTYVDNCICIYIYI